MSMSPIGREIWHRAYPLKFLGVDIVRRVTVIRLPSRDLVIHSTAPFSDEDIRSIRQLGRPRWIVDAMLDHDTFARRGTEAFPEAGYLAPDGFAAPGVAVGPLDPPPREWRDHIQTLRIEGAPGFNEVAMFHPASQTLIVCDLLLNFPKAGSWREKLLLQVGIGRHHAPGVSRRFKLAVRDRESFRQSIRRLMEWDFETVIVGHGELLETDAKRRASDAFRSAGWL